MARFQKVGYPWKECGEQVHGHVHWGHATENILPRKTNVCVALNSPGTPFLFDAKLTQPCFEGAFCDFDDKLFRISQEALCLLVLLYLGSISNWVIK